MSPPQDERELELADPAALSRRSVLLGAGAATVAAMVGFPLARPLVAAANTNDYPNGEIPLSALTAVAGHYFRQDAAQAIVALRSAYAATLGRELPINDGYRNLANQWVAWNNYQNGGNLAAYPGTSNHGWGTAVDFGGEVYSSSNSEGHRWLQTNAAAYGWWWAGRHFSQVENWHWEYDGTYSSEPEFDASVIYRRNNNMSSLYYTTVNGQTTWALAGDGAGTAAWLETQDQSLANALATQHGRAAFLTASSYAAWKSRYLGTA